MNPPNTTTATPANGESAAHDLFALTDEQILEIEPETGRDVIRDSWPATREEEATRDVSRSAEPEGAKTGQSTPAKAADPRTAETQHATENGARNTGHDAQQALAVPPEPPQWVAEAMNDPQRGKEARAFWEGTQKAQQEAAAYREVFAKPEEARSAVERARVLDEIDRAYFGATGNSAEQTSAARTQLAQTMLQENPAAFREMVFAGLHALEAAGKQGSAEAGNLSAATGGNKAAVHAEQQSGQDSSTAGRDDARNAQFAAYAAFEKAANEDLERSVGGAIERTIEQALPNAGRGGAGQASPLQARLNAAVRQDIEAALKGDRQLSEQIAQILSPRRFDGETRAQVVRLIDERARQLVPGAAKRVLQDWTQTTLATHRSRTRQNETVAARSDLAPANSDTKTPPLRSGNTSQTSDRNKSGGNRSGKVDYRKLSDEQILEL